MAKRLVVVFKGGALQSNGVVEILKKFGEYKSSLYMSTKRGDCKVVTELSVITVINLFCDEWKIKHQTPKRIVFEKE